MSITSKVQNRQDKMIKRIQIKNFKCYGEPGVDFSLKRINFIFGDNSAGKSTFLQLIRMVLNGEGQRIDDNFKSLVFKGDTTKEIKMRITAMGRKNMREEDVREKVSRVHDDPVTIEMFGEAIKEDEVCPIYDYSKKAEKQGVLGYKGWCSASEFLETGSWGRVKKNVSGQPDGKDDQDKACSELQYLWLPHVIHQEAARPVRIGVGVSMPQSSLAKKEAEFLSSDTIEYINRFFRALNVPYSAVEKGRLRDDFFGVIASTGNVGAGIDGLYETALKLYEWRNCKIEAPTGCIDDMGCALLALEEPESHVNERQISPLMNFIFNEASDVVNGQIIIECHSELALLKVMNLLRTKATSITPDDVQILYAEKRKTGTEILECHLDENGSLYDWPDEAGFFPERDRIIFGD